MRCMCPVRFELRILLAGIALLLPGAASAQTLEAPAVVEAAADGSFSYQATFTAGPGGDNVFAYVIQDLGNTDLGIFFADLFCVDPLAPGEQLLLESVTGPAGLISGALQDPSAPGSVHVSVETTCPSGGSGLVLEAVTTILPFSPTTCAGLWPVASVCTIGKGQSPSNNLKISQCITGHIVDPTALAHNATRIPVCAGTGADVQVMDTTGTPSITSGGSLSCDPTGCSGVVDAAEKYTAVSSDGRDTDRITLLPR